MREHNEENPCYISDLLACLHHGFLLPFDSLPAQSSFDNYESLNMAPATGATEWGKMADNHVVVPEEEALAELAAESPGGAAPSRCCSSPLLAVVKEADTEEALADLASRGHAEDLCEDAAGFVDRVNAALEAEGSGRRVKARLCTDFSRTFNPSLRPLPMVFPQTDELLADLPKDAWLCKVDYRRCFHNIPLHPHMFPYMGMQYGGRRWIAVRVLFGISSGPYIASILTAETACAARAQAVPVHVYIDDNAVTGRSEAECYANRDIFLRAAQVAGWPISEDKLEEDKPAQRLAFRGVVFDTKLGTLSIHVTRCQSTLRKVAALVDSQLESTFQVRRVRSVLGSLEWICCVVPLGRLHTKRVYEDLPKGCRNNWLVRLSATSRADLGWWSSFLREAVAQRGVERWAGFDAPLPECPSVRIFSDSSGDIGFGGYCQGEIYAGLWASSAFLASQSSSWKEWIPDFLILQRVAPTLSAGTIVVVTTDNQGSAFALNNGAAGPGSFDVLASILSLAAQYRLRIVGDWINRERIPLIDLTSRLSPMPGSLSFFHRLGVTISSSNDTSAIASYSLICQASSRR